MAMLQKALRILGAPVLSLAAAVALTGTAEAAPSNCGAQYICLWDGADYPGNPNIRIDQNPNHIYNNLTQTFNDRMSSWYNRTAYYAKWWPNYVGGVPSGPAQCMKPGYLLNIVSPNDTASMVEQLGINATC